MQVRSARRHAEHMQSRQACKKGEKERGGKREREEEKRRLSALGSQDALVKARQVGPGIDAGAILIRHQRRLAAERRG